MRIEGRSVFGYFADRNDAEEAKERLVRAGFSETELDAVSRYGDGGGGAEVVHNVTTGRFDSLADLTLGLETGGDDRGPLLAADAAASGYAADGTGPREKAWLVVTVTDGSDQEVERAVKILKSYGGEV